MKSDVLKKFIKFMISSGISCLVDMGLFALLNWALPKLGFSWTESVLIMIATVCARIVSSICNYMLNRKAVFKSDDRNSIIRYYILVVCQMLVSGGLVAGVMALLKLIIPELNDTTAIKTVVKGIIDFLLFFASFQIQKEWVFKKHE